VLLISFWILSRSLRVRYLNRARSPLEDCFGVLPSELRMNKFAPASTSILTMKKCPAWPARCIGVHLCQPPWMSRLKVSSVFLLCWSTHSMPSLCPRRAARWIGAQLSLLSSFTKLPARISWSAIRIDFRLFLLKIPSMMCSGVLPSLSLLLISAPLAMMSLTN